MLILSVILFFVHTVSLHIFNSIQGLCMAQPEHCVSCDWLVRLWRHECERVYSDRSDQTLL